MTGPARVLIVDDEPLMRVPLTDSLRERGYEVVAATQGEEALERLAAESFDVAVIDLRLPGADGLDVLRGIQRLGKPVDAVIITAFGTIDAAIEAMKLGARDFLQKPFETATLLKLVDRYVRVRRAAADEVHASRLADGGGCCGLVGASRPMLEVFGFIAAAADTDATILIQGETGTGKELVAVAVHEQSDRRRGPLVKVNCAAIPEPLFESELFGHERGAFTGADRRRPGRFELAAGGTLFLDEVEETPLAAQVKLLRAIQEREIERLGGVETLAVDVRLVAATKLNLRQAVAEGRFREDLFYRLNVLPVTLPPLRHRPGDVPLLAACFLRQIALEMRRPARRFSPAATDLLTRYPYPGNVRELRNLVARAVALCPSDVIEPVHLGPELHPASPAAPAAPPRLVDVVRDAEERRIDEALAQADGRKARAAEILGISRKTLWDKLRRRDR
jgi:DNA-binding NtrC family response regulator